MVGKLKRRLKYYKEYTKDMVNALSDKRLRFCVYGASSDEIWARDDYYFSKFLPYTKDELTYSKYNPHIVFFEPFFNVKNKKKYLKKTEQAFSFLVNVFILQH